MKLTKEHRVPAVMLIVVVTSISLIYDAVRIGDPFWVLIGVAAIVTVAGIFVIWKRPIASSFNGGKNDG